MKPTVLPWNPRGSSSTFCGRYVFQLLRNFLDDCARCKVDLQVPLGINGKDPLNPTDAVRQLLTVLKTPENRQVLFESCSKHDLLVIRAKELADHLKDGQSVEVTHGSSQTFELGWRGLRLHKP